MQIGLFGLFGMYAVNALIQLHAEGPLNWLTGSLLIIGGIGSFWPLNLPLNILGAGIVVMAVVLSARAMRHKLDRSQPSISPV